MSDWWQQGGPAADPGGGPAPFGWPAGQAQPGWTHTVAPSSKPPGRARWVAVSALVVVVVVVAATVASGDGGEDGGTSATTSTAVDAGDAAAATSGGQDSGGAADDIIEFEYEYGGGAQRMSATVLADVTLHDPDNEIGSACPADRLPDSGMRYIVVKTTVTNTGNRPNAPAEPMYMYLNTDEQWEPTGVSYAAHGDVYSASAGIITSYDCYPDEVKVAANYDYPVDPAQLSAGDAATEANVLVVGADATATAIGFGYGDDFLGSIEEGRWLMDL